MRVLVIWFLQVFSLILCECLSFSVSKHSRVVSSRTLRRIRSSFYSSLKATETSSSDEVDRLRQQAAKIRQELALLEGKTLAEVEREAEEDKAKRMSGLKNSSKPTNTENQRRNSLVYVPETIQDQTIQAANAIERAFKDGITRQTIRLALVRTSKSDMITPEEDLWPGGAKEMFRESARPLTELLLNEIRVISSKGMQETSPPFEPSVQISKHSPPKIVTQDIYDFDGSALMTAEAAAGSADDVQALIFPNTDNKYLKDISSIHESFGLDRLFLLVNPFWRNEDSWSFNILAPNAKKRAQETIFNAPGGGFQETYVLSRFSARGEDCVALKAYPNDWELSAYLEDYTYGRPSLTTIRLGSSKEEPTSAMFAKLLNERAEFRMNKTMRQLNSRNKY